MGYSDAVLATPGLIAYHRLGEASGTVAADSSPSAKPGTYVTATLGQPGALAGVPDDSGGTKGVAVLEANTAVQFADAFNYVDVPYNTVFALDALSVEMWVYFVGLGPLEWRAISFRGFDDLSSNWAVGLSGIANTLFGAYSDGQGLALFVGSTLLSLATWYHVCLVRNAGVGWKLYLNGVEDGSLAAAAAPVAGADNVDFGTFLAGGMIPRIDEHAIYNVALTPERIMQHYRVGKGTQQRPTWVGERLYTRRAGAPSAGSVEFQPDGDTFGLAESPIVTADPYLQGQLRKIGVYDEAVV